MEINKFYRRLLLWYLIFWTTFETRTYNNPTRIANSTSVVKINIFGARKPLSGNTIVPKLL